MGGYGWGNVQENELVDAVHAALDRGITFLILLIHTDLVSQKLH